MDLREVRRRAAQAKSLPRWKEAPSFGEVANAIASHRAFQGVGILDPTEPDASAATSSPDRVSLVSVDKLLFDPNVCDGASAGSASTAACIGKSIVTSLVADQVMKMVARKAYAYIFRETLEKMSQAALRKVSQKTAEYTAKKVVAEAVVRSGGQAATKAVSKAAVNAAMGPVGWAIEIIGAVSMIIDIGDPNGYMMTMYDDSINTLVAQMQHGLETAQVEQMCASFDVAWNSNPMTKDIDDSIRDCIKCKGLRAPAPVMPFEDFYDLDADPVLSRKINSYMLDYLVYTHRDSENDKVQLAPPLLDDGSPDVEKWVRRTRNAKGQRLNPKTTTPEEEPSTDASRTIAEKSFLDLIVSWMWTRNAKLAATMQNNVAISMVLTTVIVVMFVGILVSMITISSTFRRKQWGHVGRRYLLQRVASGAA